MAIDSSSVPGAAEQEPLLLRELIDVLYADLREMAHRERFRQRAGVMLNTTALVNEAWLKLQRIPGWRGRRHFLGTAALAMRHVLINDALARRAEKRSLDSMTLPLEEALDIPAGNDEQLLQVHDAVGKLALLSPRLAQVVECRYFAGYSDAQTAEAMGVTTRTVRRDWAKARAWLYAELGGEDGMTGIQSAAS